MKSPAYTGMYGIRGSGGVLLVTTKKGVSGSYQSSQPAPNTLIFSVPIHIQKDFYLPRFEHNESGDASLDLRSTVYWNPDVITDKKGQRNISFFANGISGKYRIIIEGIGSKGELCYSTFTYEIN